MKRTVQQVKYFTADTPAELETIVNDFLMEFCSQNWQIEGAVTSFDKAEVDGDLAWAQTLYRWVDLDRDGNPVA